MKMLSRLIFIIISLFAISSCSIFKGFSWFRNCENSYDENYKGHYKVGNPYKVNNVWYYPKDEPNYDKIGLASWYGDDFHCKKTSNNEFFNKEQLSAAHKTLPLPSVARVTNIATGKSIEVIINDRGPFVNNRIIDLSEKSAAKLGVKTKGVAPVRVQYLQHETNLLLAKINLDKHIKYTKINEEDERNNSKLAALKLESRNIVNSNKKLLPKIVSNANLKNIPQETKISIGNYLTKGEAISSVKKLSNFGLVKYTETRVKNKKIYEVQFSKSVNDENQAKKLLQKIISLGYKNARIINS